MFCFNSPDPVYPSPHPHPHTPPHTCTGYTRPVMPRTAGRLEGTPPPAAAAALRREVLASKKSTSLSTSSVAELMTRRSSGRRFWTWDRPQQQHTCFQWVLLSDCVCCCLLCGRRTDKEQWQEALYADRGKGPPPTHLFEQAQEGVCGEGALVCLIHHDDTAGV